MIKYIPVPVVTGFTAGIAVYIFSTQVKDFLGLHVSDKVPAEFLPKVIFLGRHLGELHWPSLLLAVAAVTLIKLWPASWARRVPGSIAAVVLGTAFLAVLEQAGLRSGIETIGSRFGADAIPQSLPVPHWPQIELAQLKNLIRPALTIALLAAIESLLCAVVADGMIEDRHDSNTELVAQGLANIGSAIFGGLPATGALARTATNVRSGARTPVAGVVHALTILAIVLVAAPLARFIPLPVLSGVLVVVALNMGEWHHFGRLRGWPKSDASVYLITFLLTVLTDITVAVEVGMIMAAVLFIKRISETTQITAVDERAVDLAPEDSLRGKDVPKGVVVYQLFGAFLFGAADKLETTLARAGGQPDVLILGMKRVMAMDATGLHALEDLHHDLRKRGKWLLLAGPHTQPLMMMSRDGFIERIGEENLCEHVDAALARARRLLAERKPAG
jgi:SulP family sulfate permease